MLLGMFVVFCVQRPVRRKGSFRQAAAGMLQNTSGLLRTASVQVVFDDDGMKVIAQGSTGSRLPYAEM